MTMCKLAEFFILENEKGYIKSLNFKKEKRKKELMYD